MLMDQPPMQTQTVAVLSRKSRNLPLGGVVAEVEEGVARGEEHVGVVDKGVEDREARTAGEEEVPPSLPSPPPQWQLPPRAQWLLLVSAFHQVEHQNEYNPFMRNMCEIISFSV